MELITQQILAVATQRMLETSIIGRYVRIAKETAERSGLTEALADAERAREAIARAQALWREVETSDDRKQAEFELCILLAALADAQPRPEDVDALLQQVADSTGYVAGYAWHVARRLRWKHGIECRACGGSESAYFDMAGIGSSGPIWGQHPCWHCLSGEEATDEDAAAGAQLREQVHMGDYDYAYSGGPWTVCPCCKRPWGGGY